MRFANPLYLLAMAGVALPVLIHLLTRDRVRRVAFSTLRFFADTAQQVLNRRKWRERLLLGMRMAMLALLALAFARPLAGGSASPPAAGQARHARVVLLDVSASMQGEGLAQAARTLAGEALDALDAGPDAAALVTFDRAARLAAPLAHDFSDARARLALLQPGQAGADLPAALRYADTLLAAVDATHKSIVLVSDCRRAGWSDLPPGWRLSPGVTLEVRPVAAATDDAREALAIVEAQVPQSLVRDGLDRVLAVRVANFGHRDRPDLGVTLAMAGQDLQRRTVHVPAGQTVPVRFRHAFDAPGDNSGTIRLDGDDGQAGVLYFNTRVIPRIGVLIVNGRSHEDPRTDGGFLLNLALAPGPESPFEPRVVRAGQVSPADVRAARVVVLSDVESLPSDVLEALSELLERGGGVLWLPGAQVRAEPFNAAFAELAPCRLSQAVEPRSALGSPAETALGEVDYDHPIFAVFHRPHHGHLGGPRFARYWEVTDSQLARVSARFTDGRPALLERPRGRGIAMLLVNPVGGGWNDLPVRHGALFVSWLHQMVHHLAVRTESRTAYAVGELIDVPEGHTLLGPDGEPLTGGPLAAEPGLYALRDPAGQVAMRLAVNRDGRHADPATIDPDEIIAAVQPTDSTPLTAQAAGAVPEDPSGLWWYLLGALALLVPAELWLANSTPRH